MGYFIALEGKESLTFLCTVNRKEGGKSAEGIEFYIKQGIF